MPRIWADPADLTEHDALSAHCLRLRDGIRRHVAARRAVVAAWQPAPCPPANPRKWSTQ